MTHSLILHLKKSIILLYQIKKRAKKEAKSDTGPGTAFSTENSPAKRYFFTFPFSFQLCCKGLVYRMKILKKDRSASFQETGREGFIP
jgi:hypothetical protein